MAGGVQDKNFKAAVWSFPLTQTAFFYCGLNENKKEIKNGTFIKKKTSYKDGP